ncbi:MAG: hypothetical protein L3J56_00480 [Bacteroidales bacterium]|nr:hypothetical protein [Bacteroidales bacterium]
MTNLQEINNEQIKRIFEQKIQGKKDVFFLILTGSLGDNKLSPLHDISEEYAGEAKFFDMLEEAFEEDPYYLGIALYRKAVKKIAKKPFYFKKIKLKKDKPDNTLGSLATLESFGGLEGVLEAKINTKYLANTNEELKIKIEKLERANESLTAETKKYKENNSELKEKIRTKDWLLRTLEEDHKRALDGIEQKSERFEKFLTIGGLVAARAAGLDEGDLRGILGIEDEPESIANTSKEQIDTSDIDVEETETFTGKKAEAKAMIDAINVFFLDTLRNNNDTEAFNIIATFSNIVNYARADFNNLKILHDIVVKSSQNHGYHSPANSISEQAKNYNK